MSGEPSTTEDSRPIWVWKWGPFMMGRTDALDDGWTMNGRLITTAITNASPGLPDIFGIGLVWGKKLFSFYVGKVWQTGSMNL